MWLMCWCGWSADLADQLIYFLNDFWKFWFFLILNFYASLLPKPRYYQLIFQTHTWLAWGKVLSIILIDKYLIGLSLSIVNWSFRQILDWPEPKYCQLTFMTNTWLPINTWFYDKYFICDIFFIGDILHWRSQSIERLKLLFELWN